jgi:tetratricopeptide (TPR) repeat protein
MKTAVSGQRSAPGWDPRQRARWRSGPLALCFLLCALVAVPAAAREFYGLSDKELGLYAGSAYLASWQVPQARAAAEKVLAGDPKDEDARELLARVLFFEGRYGEALKALDGLGVRGRFRELVAATAQHTRGFSSRTSEHFEVLWGSPKDEVLVGPALEGLEAAWSALSETLGFAPGRRVRLEIYPDPARGRDLGDHRAVQVRPAHGHEPAGHRLRLPLA